MIPPQTWDLLFGPFANPTAETIAKAYLAVLAAILTMERVYRIVGVARTWTLYRMYHRIGFGSMIVTVGILSPIFEELVFRGIPYLALGPGPLFVAASVVWLLLHGKRFLIVAPTLPLFVKLWTSGLIVEAIGVHIVHNSIMICLYAAYIRVNGVPDEIERNVLNSE